MAVADDHGVDERLARQLQLAHPVPGRRRRPGQPEGDHVPAHLADPARLEEAFRQRRLVGGEAQVFGLSGSKLAPCTRVEVTTTKKTIANSSSPLRTPATTGKVASQIGVAPRSPAQPSMTFSALLSGEKSGRGEGGQRAGDEDQYRREGDALDRHVGDVLREHQQPEQDEEADLGHPAGLVEGDDAAPRRDAGRAECQRGEVDRRAARSRGRPRRRRRRALATAIVATG